MAICGKFLSVFKRKPKIDLKSDGFYRLIYFYKYNKIYFKKNQVIYATNFSSGNQVLIFFVTRLYFRDYIYL